MSASSEHEHEHDNDSGKDHTVFVTNDHALSRSDAVLTDADRQILEASRTGEGTITLGEFDGDQILASRDVLDEVAQAARLSHTKAGNLTLFMGKKQATFVRELRVEKIYSWRSVAQACYDAWGGDWQPPSNQLVGMAFCETAARKFSEDYMVEPWN